MSSGLIGKVFLDQYRVDAFVASGGMAAVYRVWDLKRNVPLAMKVLHADLADDPSIFKRFQREARALQRLAHPNIVPFYGLFHAGDLAFLLERFIDGPSLKDILRSRKGSPLRVDEALVYLKAISSALGYAHTRGVIHCDVKPGNVMVDRGGSVYLTDFGVARHAESTTTTLGFAGTAGYMAPEQVRGEPVSPATDVYALGVMLYEMLSGERPFRGDEHETEGKGPTGTERVRWAHLHLAPPNPLAKNPALPPQLAQVILKALAKHPEARYESVRELYQVVLETSGLPMEEVHEITISSVDSEQSRLALPGASAAPPGRLPARTLAPRGLAIVIASLIVIGILGLVLLRGNTALNSTSGQAPTIALTRATASPGATSGAFSPTTSGAETQRVISGPTPKPTSTNAPTQMPTFPPGSGQPLGKIAFTCQVFKDEKRNQICLMNADGSHLTRMTKNDTADQLYGSLAPDGIAIAYSSNATGEYEIYEMDLAGAERRITNIGEAYAPSISPSGDSIVFTHTSGAHQDLWMVDHNGGNPRPLTAGDAWDEWDPVWSPGGDQLLFASNRAGGVELFIMQADGTNVQRVTISGSTYSRDISIRGRSDWPPDGRTVASYIGNTWHWQIFEVAINGSNFRLLTSGGNNLAPSYCPDGRWITFTSFRDLYGYNGGCEIYIMRIDGTDVQRLTNNDYCDWQPRWGP